MGKRLKFDERFLQAKREIKSFSEKKYTFEETSEILEKAICEFICVSNNKKFFPSNDVYKYDLAGLYKSSAKNKHIEDFLNKTLITKYHPYEVLSNDSLHYIYVVQRYDGMACVVGRSQFSINSKLINLNDENSNLLSSKIEVVTNKFGDLFDNIAPTSEPTSPSKLKGTQKLIYDLLKEVYNNNFDKIKEEMENYYAQAFVIPVQGGKSIANTFESLLGEYLKSKNIDILNVDSHLW
ncbi:hypothetical protein CW676_05055 [Macrococcoides caseolyticum]|uniref:hypothetical protein n=1 Tax=Macrococcoides caseolyticum TaxID=69966 RepID=UPI000C333D1E|nr:hypothetical protein [Macrococcus caseolyticus]PKE06634.1 hypothetical protein CW692_07430 [Macrococcus caseolyticus]PKE24407.1 hypothetical protein CW689_04550 [Macrococcus caseolyticus]PKE53649.1 hypothetical protein CW676_05055 [Macrococcus caseolyticus]PKF38792.1 hypothetical protein CW681_05385 [Macrococcus caseolyticus]